MAVCANDCVNTCAGSCSDTCGGACNATCDTTCSGSSSDITPPGNPVLLTATYTDTSITLSWGAATDDVGVTGYNIYNGNTLIGNMTGMTYTISGLLPVASYTYTVKAKDAAGNESSGSSITVTIPVPAGYTGVRYCLEGKYCLDSNQIGFANEKVTVNGTPLNISGLIHGGDGYVYATQADIDTAYMEYLQSSNDYNITSEVYNSYVEQAQTYLKNLGYYLGTFGDNGDGIDGKWKAGGVTYTAIIQFQKSCKSRWTGIMASNPPQDVIQAVAYLNLNPTGMLDQETLNALSIESANAVPASGLPVYGETSTKVTELQSMLKIVKAWTGNGSEEVGSGSGGVFGNVTYSSVCNFQQWCQDSWNAIKDLPLAAEFSFLSAITSSGVVNQYTWDALKICIQKELDVTRSLVDQETDNPTSAMIFQSPRRKGLDQNGNQANDMKTNDFTREQILAINSLFQYQLDEEYGVNSPETLFTVFEEMATSLFSQGEMETVILDMINHFKNGNGVDYSNATLTSQASAPPTTQAYIELVKNEFLRELVIYNGNLADLQYNEATKSTNMLYNYVSANAQYPVFNSWADTLGGLTITVNDTWGNIVEVKNYSKDGNRLNGTLHFTIYDHFGLDQPDVEKVYVNLAGFRAWFVLQYYTQFNGQYKPFATVMEIDVPFEVFLVDDGGQA